MASDGATAILEFGGTGRASHAGTGEAHRRARRRTIAAHPAGARLSVLSDGAIRDIFGIIRSIGAYDSARGESSLSRLKSRYAGRMLVFNIKACERYMRSAFYKGRKG